MVAFFLIFSAFALRVRTYLTYRRYCALLAFWPTTPWCRIVPHCERIATGSRVARKRGWPRRLLNALAGPGPKKWCGGGHTT